MRVRLVGINAPEGDQEFGRASRLLLESLVLGRAVEVWVNAGQYVILRRSEAKEVTGVVHLRHIEMLDVNLLMIQAGLARYVEVKPYMMSRYMECHYRRAEEDSRASRRGLWRGAA